jgi:hypothetical protein
MLRESPITTYQRVIACRDDSACKAVAKTCIRPCSADRASHLNVRQRPDFYCPGLWAALPISANPAAACNRRVAATLLVHAANTAPSSSPVSSPSRDGRQKRRALIWFSLVYRAYVRPITEAGLPLLRDLRSEESGQRHLITADPNRVLIGVIITLPPSGAYAAQVGKNETLWYHAVVAAAHRCCIAATICVDELPWTGTTT